MEKLYNEYLPLIKGRTRDFYQSHKHLEFEELFSEASLAFVEACYNYNSNKSKFSTHLFNQITFKLQTFLMEESERLSQFKTYPMNEVDKMIDYHSHYSENYVEKITIQDRINSFPKDVMNAILNPDKKELKQKRKTQITENLISKQLKRKGWQPWEIRKVFNGLRREFV